MAFFTRGAVLGLLATASLAAANSGAYAQTHNDWPNRPVNSLNELIALARSKPGKVDAAFPSVTGQLVPETQKALGDLGFERAPVFAAAELNAWLREERRNYAHVIKTANMKPE